MIPLKIKGVAHNITDTVVGQIVKVEASSLKIRLHKNSCTNNSCTNNIDSTKEELFATKDKLDKGYSNSRGVSNLPFISNLSEGDIVSINPQGIINTLFRVKSGHNSLFITDRCNSNCLMCSQPPKDRDDLSYHYTINKQVIDLIPAETEQLGITGGEPTLLGGRLIELFSQIKERLPETQIHVLTNGRTFAWKQIPRMISEVENRNIVFGIPLYSDYFLDHDYVVQAKDAFNQTILGFHNMARFGQRLELRVVLHQQTYKRLPQLARFIYKNLPFVEHVAFMGLEYTGYTPYNSSILWIEPEEYLNELEDAVLFLDRVGMNISIYNSQLCLLSHDLWKFSRKSISDWKQEFTAECKECALLEQCGGVFATSKKHSSKIKAIKKTLALNY
jgi:His-Xaa-Ser system radical SAM maturase HxsC